MIQNPPPAMVDVSLMRSQPPLPPVRPATTTAAGFTLIEIMTIVAVIAIGSALVMPMFRDQSATQLRSAAQLLAADLDAAKIESLTHANDPRLVVFDLENHRYHLAASSDPDTPITNPFDRNPYRVTFGSKRAAALGLVRIGNLSLDGDDQLGFGIYGQLDQTAPATIQLTADNDAITLTLDPATGEVEIGPLQSND